MEPLYLKTRIEAAKVTVQPRWGMTRAGYTVRGGAPTRYLVRLTGETRWRRLMVWQTSNMGTCFVRIKGQSLIVSDTSTIQEIAT